MGAFETGRQTFAFDKVHHIIGGAVLVEQVVHPYNVLVFEFAQAACFLAELFALCIECALVLGKADGDVSCIVHAAAHAFNKEFLDGNSFVKGGVDGHVGIAKAARCQVFFYTVFAIGKCGANGKQPLAGGGIVGHSMVRLYLFSGLTVLLTGERGG